MRNITKLAVALTCLGVFATLANAQWNGTWIEFYFSTTGPGDVMPPEYAAYENPVLPASGGTAYLWAFVFQGDLWYAIALENQGALATGGEMYNDPLPVLGSVRWETDPGACDFDPVSDNYIFGFSVQQMGLGYPWEAIADSIYGWDYYIPGTNHAGYPGGHYLVATYDFDGSAPVFLAPGAGGISLSGGGPGEPLVYFGFNADGTDLDDPLWPNEVGTPSSVADLTFIPEPASLLLLALAAPALRRR